MGGEQTEGLWEGRPIFIYLASQWTPMAIFAIGPLVWLPDFPGHCLPMFLPSQAKEQSVKQASSFFMLG